MLPKLLFPTIVWRQLVGELYRRGDNQVESGALLLGRVGHTGVREIAQVIYYDDIDPTALDRGYVYLDRRQFGKVWNECREAGLHVVADVHTHPGLALQSASDQANPIIPRTGHLAIIIPDFATLPVDLNHVGVFEYLGSGQWSTLSDRYTLVNTIQISGSP